MLKYCTNLHKTYSTILISKCWLLNYEQNPFHKEDRFVDHFQKNFFLNLPHLKPDKPISCYTYLLIMYIHTNVVIIIWPFHFLKTSSSPIWHTEFFCCQNFNLSLLFWHQLSSTTSQVVIVHHLFCGLILTKLVRNHIFDELKILDYGFACHNLFVQIILMRLLIFFLNPRDVSSNIYIMEQVYGGIRKKNS